MSLHSFVRWVCFVSLLSSSEFSRAETIIEVIRPSVCCSKAPQVATVKGSTSVIFEGEGVDLGMAQGPLIGAHKTILKSQVPALDGTRRVKVGLQIGVSMMEGSFGSIRLSVSGTTQDWKLKGPRNEKVYKFLTVRVPKGQEQILLVVDLEAARTEGGAAQLVLDSLDLVAGKLVGMKPASP